MDSQEPRVAALPKAAAKVVVVPLASEPDAAEQRRELQIDARSYTWISCLPTGQEH